MRRALAIAAACVGVALAGCAGTPQSDPGAIAAAYADAGRYDAAAREIELAVRAYPRNVALREQAARIHTQAGNLPTAVAHLEAAIEMAPNRAELWIQLGDLETHRQNPADAYVAYRRATELAPNDIRAVSGLALAADSLGFDDEANTAYAHWAELENRQQKEAPLLPER